MIVHKFGGTSVGNAARFSDVAEIVCQRHAGSERTPTDVSIVVVSAMEGVTDSLIAGARAAAEGKDTTYRSVKAELLSRHLETVDTLLNDSRERLIVGGLIEDQLHDLERLYRSIAVLGELTGRGCDAVAAFGEYLSVHILAAALRERGVRARAISSIELIVTDNHFGAAAPLMELTRRRLQKQLVPLLERGTLPVLTGYIGATEDGATTTLGRNGGDFSAAIIGAALSADEIWIWSDVDGILTADPKIVPQARTLAELSYAEASELAYVGAEVLHPRTIRPVVQGKIPLRIVNSFNPVHSGTLIVEEPSPDREVLPAIISATGLSMIAVGSKDDSWTLGLAAHALQELSQAGLDVLMFSQSLSEHNLNLVVHETDQDHCLLILRREFKTKRGNDVFHLGVEERVATISVVAMPGWNDRERRTVSRAFSALGERDTRVISVAQAMTERSVSFCIPEDQLADAVSFLHRRLGLEDRHQHDPHREEAPQAL